MNYISFKYCDQVQRTKIHVIIEKSIFIDWSSAEN